MDYTTFLTPSLGIGGVVVLAVIMLLRGDIVPRKQVDTLLSVKDQQITFLEKANGDLNTALGERDRQLTEMMVTSRTTRTIIAAALPEVAGSNHEGGAHAPAPEG